jgi:hypothetical protein
VRRLGSEHRGNWDGDKGGAEFILVPAAWLLLRQRGAGAVGRVFGGTEVEESVEVRFYGSSG